MSKINPRHDIHQANVHHEVLERCRPDIGKMREQMLGEYPPGVGKIHSVSCSRQVASNNHLSAPFDNLHMPP